MDNFWKAQKKKKGTLMIPESEQKPSTAFYIFKYFAKYYGDTAFALYF